jgi:cytochrome c5
VSKQDTHFFNMFSIVIALLAAITVGIFVLSRIVAGRTQEQHVLVERQYLEAVEERLQPVARVAVAGEDNSALAIEESPGASDATGGGAAAAMPTSGPEVYEQACAACHGQGIAGAPRAGDAAAWEPRIAQGQDILYQHAIQGFQGKAGVMPPKGGFTDLSDEAVRAAVDHMVEMAK